MLTARDAIVRRNENGRPKSLPFSFEPVVAGGIREIAAAQGQSGSRQQRVTGSEFKVTLPVTGVNDFASAPVRN